MKRICLRLFCLALLGVVLLGTLASCGYPQIDPSAEESGVVMRMGDFDVTLDMFRAEYFKAKTAVDGGRAEYWNNMSEEEKTSWMRKFANEATRNLAELYAPLSLAKKEGIDPFGGEVNRLVSQGRTDAINSLAAEDKYGAYLTGLKEVYFTDYVFRMNLRSTACIEKLESKLCNKGGALYPTPEALAEAPLSDIEAVVRPCGLYRTKAKNLKDSCEKLVREFDGVLPSDMETLLTFPGVGRKIANLLRGDVFGLGGIVADTHCIRIAARLGLTAKGEKDPLRTEKALAKLICEDKQSDFCHRMVMFGRDVCTARAPRCGECPLRDLCPENKK